MSAIEFRLLAHHFGFHPDAKLQPHVVDGSDELGKRPAELGLVDRPVAEAALVVVAVGKPAVVHHQQLDAHPFGELGKLHQTVAVKVKVEGLPAVDEHRAHPVAPVPAAHMLAHAAVQVVGEQVQAHRRIGHDDLRRNQLRAWLERIGEELVGKAQLQARLAILVTRRLALEAAAVDELHGPAAPRGLGRIAIGKDQQRVLLMRGGTLGTVHHAGELADGRTLGHALHAVAPREAD